MIAFNLTHAAGLITYQGGWFARTTTATIRRTLFMATHSPPSDIESGPWPLRDSHALWFGSHLKLVQAATHQPLRQIEIAHGVEGGGVR